MHFNLVYNIGINVIEETLQRSLITEASRDNTCYIEVDQIWKWAESIGLHHLEIREKFIEDTGKKRIKLSNQEEHKTLANTEHEVCAEIWTKSFLKSTGSSGVIHSIHTGKHPKFIMCNIRYMNACEESHKDYFNDSTIYINLEEKQFSIRTNRIPYNKKTWVWQPMI